MGKMIISLLAAGLLTLAIVVPALASAHKTTFCHLTGNSIYTVVDVSGGAITTYQNHDGDYEWPFADVGATSELCAEFAPTA